MSNAEKYGLLILRIKNNFGREKVKINKQLQDVMFILFIQSSLRRQSVFYLYLHATLCHKIANNGAIKMFSSGAYVCGKAMRKDFFYAFLCFAKDETNQFS